MAKVGFTTKGYIEVWWQSPAGLVFLSRHRQETEAIESLTTHAATQTGDQTYELRFPNKIVKAYGILASQGPAPATPTGLVLEDVTAGFVAVAWDNAGDATQWTVYRDGVSKGTTSNASFTDSTVVPSHADYSYQVQASNAAGASALSAALLVTTPANSLPSFVLGGQALILNVGFSLNLSSYADDSDGHTLTFTKTSGSVPGLSLVGSTYSGTPTAVGAYPVVFDVFDGYDHVSSGTITFTVSDPDVTAPTVPGSVVASVNGSTVTVTWNASTDASGILRYRVFRGGTFRANADASPYVETGVPVGAYTYSVSAVDASANANESAQGSAPPVSVIPQNPDTPINFTATAASSSQINLAWAAGPSGAAPDDYDVDFATAGASGPWTSLSFTGTATTYQHTGRTASTQYWYRVRANKAGSTSSGYATASATTAGARKWNPGHYVQFWNVNQSFRFSAYAEASINTNTKLKGVMVSWPWKDLEGAQGDYGAGIALVNAELTRLRQCTVPKRLCIWVMDQGYSDTPSLAAIFPAYLNAAGYTYLEGSNAFWKPWIPAAMDRMRALVATYGAAFDGQADVEMIRVGQATQQFGTPYSTYPNYRNAYRVQYQRLGDQLQASWPTTVRYVPLSWEPYDGAEMSALMSYYDSVGVGYGGPDQELPWSGTTVYTDRSGGLQSDLYTCGSSGGVDHRARTPMIRAAEDSEMGWGSVAMKTNRVPYTGVSMGGQPSVGGYTAQEIFDYCNWFHASHILWPRTMYCGTNYQRWYNYGTLNPGGILQVIENSTLNWPRPPNWS